MLKKNFKKNIPCQGFFIAVLAFLLRSETILGIDIELFNC